MIYHFLSESASISVCKYLLDEGARLNIYDPKVESQQVMLEFSNSQLNLPCEVVKERIRLYSDDKILHACEKSHALVVCTEWDIFKVSPNNHFNMK